MWPELFQQVHTICLSLFYFEDCKGFIFNEESNRQKNTGESQDYQVKHREYSQQYLVITLYLTDGN